MASEIIDVQLYNGQFHMIHNPNAKGSSPRYKIIDGDGKITSKPKGVTTILGQTLAKDLVGWALDCMSDVLSDKLPVVTQADINDAKLESGRRRDAGAGTGSETHSMVERFLKARKNGDTNVTMTSNDKEAMNAYMAFVKWFNSGDIEIIDVEGVGYSAEYEVAGTRDNILRWEGKVYMGDLKTTNPSRKAPNGVYAENFLQLGAYAMMYEEQRAFEEKAGGTKLVPIEGLMVISAKKNGKLDVVTNEMLGVSVDDCVEMFRKVVNLYNFLGYLTKSLGGK